MISWGKPEPGKFKVNVDESRLNDGVIGAGGVIRDGSGNWTNGFMINIGAVEVLQSEAWSVFHGLLLVVSLQIRNIIVESDSAVLVALLQ